MWRLGLIILLGTSMALYLAIAASGLLAARPVPRCASPRMGLHTLSASKIDGSVLQMSDLAGALLSPVYPMR